MSGAHAVLIVPTTGLKIIPLRDLDIVTNQKFLLAV